MKHARKLASLLLALVMVFALATTAFAAGTNTITVKNAVSGQKYELYKILDLSVNENKTAYSYTVNSTWADFFKSPNGKGLTYVDIDKQGYVTWKEGADVAAFAKDAEAFAKELAALQNITADKDGDITFSGLEAGYYLVTSTLGTKATVGTTPSDPNPKIQEKNQVPTNEKTVEEDSKGNYVSTNDAEIGQTVNFKSTITAQPGAENYVFEDTMSAGLTYKKDAKVYTDEDMTTELAAENYTVNNTPDNGETTFTITFTQSYLDTIDAETKLYVKYSAMLNENAVVGLAGNSNKSTLKYGDSTNTKSTPASETITYTWDLDVLKYGNNDESNVLENAQFVLLNEDEKKVAVVVNGKLTGWENVPAAGEDGTITWPENTVLTTDAQGKIHISGLDSDTYYLREIKAPDGYNTLKKDVQVVITGVAKGEDYKTALVKIQNLSGTQLPSTGGMGTTIFYVLGSALVLGAVVLLVTKKRMSTKD